MNINNQLKLSRMALEDRNGDEALSHISKILEIDAENANAWLMKGTATAFITKGIDIDLRYQEAISCFTRAESLGYPAEELKIKRDEVKELFRDFYCTLGSQSWNSAVSLANVNASAGFGGYERAG